MHPMTSAPGGGTRGERKSGGLTHTQFMVCLVLGLLAGLALAKGAQALGQGSSGVVSVCAAAHYNATLVQCTVDDGTIADPATAEIVVQADHHTFVKDTLVYRLAQVLPNGTEQSICSQAGSGNLSSYRRHTHLGVLFAMCGVSPVAGSTYDVSVGYSDAADGISQLLGSDQFTYSASTSS
jgi:hypothetical protein